MGEFTIKKDGSWIFVFGNIKVFSKKKLRTSTEAKIDIGIFKKSVKFAKVIDNLGSEVVSGSIQPVKKVVRRRRKKAE